MNEDKAVFNVSTFDETRGRAFYFSAQNNRILVNFRRSNGTWEFNPSRVAVQIPETMTSPEHTIALGVVLASDTFDFYNAYNGQRYKRLMYFIYQGNPSTPQGGVCAAFSNDGVTWAQPAIRIGLAGTAVTACQQGSTTTLKLESISGARSGNTLWLAGLEGDIPTLLQFAQSGRTLTYLIRSDVNSPHVLNIRGELPAAGIYAPTYPGGNQDYYMRNLDFTYDPATDKALLVRVTPFPYDLDGSVPCSGVCPRGLGTFPMRGQVYSQKVNGNPEGLLTGSWKLEGDIGKDTGWSTRRSDGSCRPYPAGDLSQTSIGLDLDSLNIHKTRLGFVQKESTSFLRLYMGGWVDRQNSCNTWSTAAETFLDGALYEGNLFLSNL